MFNSCVAALLHRERKETIIEEEKQTQRRAFFRASYPHTSRLRILNMDAYVADICQVGLRFCCSNQWEKLSKIIENDEILEISIILHDNTVEDIKGHIAKCYSDIVSKEQHYILMFIKSIKHEIISHEQSYLLKNFPEFSKQLFLDPTIIEIKRGNHFSIEILRFKQVVFSETHMC